MKIKTLDMKLYRQNYRANNLQKALEYGKKWRAEKGITPRSAKVELTAEAYRLRRRTYAREYYQKNKVRLNAFTKERYWKDKYKPIARSKARRKIPIPTNQLCQLCEKNLATQRHHRDYSKPYYVLFVCTTCHGKI